MLKMAKFTQMKDGDREDYVFLKIHETEFASKTAQRLLKALLELDSSLSGYQISRLQHSLQSATRAFRDGADIDWIVCALLHDIGDIYAPYNHDEYAAAILRPFVREQCSWVVGVHADFQLFYYGHHIGANRHKRAQHRGNPYFDDCAEFCERWDQSSFEPNYDTLPLEFFAPMVEKVFSRFAYDPAVIQEGVREPLVSATRAEKRKQADTLSMLSSYCHTQQIQSEMLVAG